MFALFYCRSVISFAYCMCEKIMLNLFQLFSFTATLRAETAEIRGESFDFSFFSFFFYFQELPSLNSIREQEVTH